MLTALYEVERLGMYLEHNRLPAKYIQLNSPEGPKVNGDFRTWNLSESVLASKLRDDYSAGLGSHHKSPGPNFSRQQLGQVKVMRRNSAPGSPPQEEPIAARTTKRTIHVPQTLTSVIVYIIWL